MPWPATAAAGGSGAAQPLSEQHKLQQPARSSRSSNKGQQYISSSSRSSTAAASSSGSLQQQSSTTRGEGGAGRGPGQQGPRACAHARGAAEARGWARKGAELRPVTGGRVRRLKATDRRGKGRNRGRSSPRSSWCGRGSDMESRWTGGAEERRGGDERSQVPRSKAAPSSRCRCSEVERVPVVEGDERSRPPG